MRLEIRRRGVTVTEGLRNSLKERLRRALSRFGRHIDLIRVYLRDVNGPRGGLGKRCRVVVGLRRGGRVVVNGTGAEASAAIIGTVGRAGLAVKRHVKRRLARRRPPRRRGRRAPLVAVGPAGGIEELGDQEGGGRCFWITGTPSRPR